ncbi:MAG: hypothetical protein PHU85_02675 [Phycisphaerae bacterium]|nr:hypothetical protein [Phycisphaerae bacterium]
MPDFLSSTPVRRNLIVEALNVEYRRVPHVAMPTALPFGTLDAFWNHRHDQRERNP